MPSVSEPLLSRNITTTYLCESVHLLTALNDNYLIALYLNKADMKDFQREVIPKNFKLHLFIIIVYFTNHFVYIICFSLQSGRRYIRPVEGGSSSENEPFLHGGVAPINNLSSITGATPWVFNSSSDFGML